MARAEWQAVLCFFHYPQDSEMQLPVVAGASHLFPERRHSCRPGVDECVEADKNVGAPIAQVANIGKNWDAPLFWRAKIWNLRKTPSVNKLVRNDDKICTPTLGFDGRPRARHRVGRPDRRTRPAVVGAGMGQRPVGGP